MALQASDITDRDRQTEKIWRGRDENQRRSRWRDEVGTSGIIDFGIYDHRDCFMDISPNIHIHMTDAFRMTHHGDASLILGRKVGRPVSQMNQIRAVRNSP
jgi:hypothetical protein